MRILAVLFLSALGCVAQLVPWCDNPAYTRNEPVNIPWWVQNNGQPSCLYYNGELISQDTGTNDLNLITVWRTQSVIVKVGMVDAGSHGNMVQSILAKTMNSGTIYRHELMRWYALDVAAGIVDCVEAGCKVVCVATGFASPDESLRVVCIYAGSCGVVIVCAAPDIWPSVDLDNGFVDYPYAWHLANVLPVNSTTRTGNLFDACGYGTNCVAAPGRNIVGFGMYGTGTSYAAAIMTGCVAMLLSRNSTLSPPDCIRIIRQTATPIDGPGCSPIRVNILAALLATAKTEQCEVMPPQL